MIILWLKENLQRLFVKSPTFFKIWGVISAFFAALTTLPDLISSISALGIHIPDLWNQKATLIVRCVSLAFVFMSSLTTQSKPAAIKTDGTVLKETHENLSFTAVKELKDADKHDLPVVIENLK